MINVSELFKQVANRDSRTFRAKAIINDIEYKEFREVKITQSCESNTSLSFGSTSSACLNVTIVDVDKGVILTGQKIKLFIGLKTNDSLDMFDDDSAYTYIQVGEFNVDTPSWEDSDVKITAYDHFYLCEQGFFTNLSGMQKVKNIVSEQCTKLGIEFVDDIEDVSYNVDVLKGLTIREAFGYLASFLGKNARFDNLGKLQFVWYTDSQLTIDSDRFSSPLTIGNAYAIGSLSCIVRTTTTNDDGVTQNEDTTYTSGSGEGISFSNLYMTQERLNTLLSRIKNFSIRSAQLNWNMALPQITVGDIINVKDVDNTIYVIPIMEYTIDIDGGCYGTVKSKFVSQTEQSKEFKGSLSQQVERIYTDYGSFKEIITEKITAFNGEFVQINADFVNVNQKLTALEAKIGDLDVTELSARVATIEEAYISKAQVEQLYATKAEIGTISANVAEIQEAMIGVAYVDDLNALEAKINEIEAGSVTTDYLETNYAKIDLSNIENGCITTAMIGTGVVGTAQIADGSITDAKIVGLTANKLTAGTIDASDIEVINLNCANLTVGTINGQQIANNAIDWDKLNSQVSGTINNANTNANQALEDALEAMQEAQSAANAAQSAQTTANGKNTVIYATAQPSTSGRKTNDIWFDTDDGNKMYYFNGTSWVAAQFGTNAIKSASITNALIADAAINNAKISNLDAGKITTGTLSADRIGANSITSAKIAANAIIAGKIAASAVTTSTIAADAVNADKIAAKSINAEHINGAIITGDMIVASTITGAKIAAKTITANNIAADTITAAQIASGTITSTEINVGSVKAAILTANSITSTMIAANAITSDKIAANAITSAKIATDAIKSRNYVANSAGSYLNLQDGSFTSKNLKWTSDGTLTATNGNFSGTITATDGKIANWIISSTSMSCTNTADDGWTYTTRISGATSITSSSTNIVIYRQKSGTTEYLFHVRPSGEMMATNARITGTITGSTISGSTISGGTISGASITGGSITSNTSINVTTDLKVGKNIYLDQNTPNTIKTIQFNGNNYIQNINLSSNNSYIKMQSNYRAALMANGGASVVVTGNAYGKVGVELTNPGDTIVFEQSSNSTYSAFFRPNSNGRVTLGIASNRFFRLYQSQGSIDTSDERKKHNILPIKDNYVYEKLFNSLIPKTYCMNNDDIVENSKVHIGFIAQDIAKTLSSLNLNENETGLIDYACWTDENGNQKDEYGLCYSEFIALNTHMIQKTILRVDNHDKELQYLRNKNIQLRQELKNTQDKLDAFINGNYQIREVIA
ncbi:tail fiber domain-containing protein [Clostridium sp. C1]|uniref:tail fiber domain-containing protein n=1 Tax=Clostridium sp. C1 TaxID=1155388 RepID=UPI001BA4B99A|nr:tail fiber domain-containing protein [Clostridium sp. C1]QUN13613.1 tail fiber domain-containing protein [Clostridium sp. C1]